MIKCPNCDGGQVEVNHGVFDDCPTCGGDGVIPEVCSQQDIFDEIHAVMDSLEFEARGRVDRAAIVAHRIWGRLRGRRIE